MDFINKFMSLMLSDGIGQATVIVGVCVIMGLMCLLQILSRRAEGQKSNFRVIMHFEAGTRGRPQKKAKKSRSPRKLNEFGELIRTFRVGRGKSIAFLADALNMSEADVSKLEAGQIQPTNRILDDISLYLGLSREDRLKLYRSAPRIKKVEIK